MAEDKMAEIDKVQQIAARGRDYKPGRNSLELPAAERAEQLWGLFNEYSSYRRNLLKTALDANLGPRDRETGRRERSLHDLSKDARGQIITTVGQDALIQRLEGEVSHLWRDPHVRGIFVAKAREGLSERREHTPKVREYKRLKSREVALEDEYFDLLRNQFLMRQMTPTLRAMDIARNRAESEVVEQSVTGLETTGGMDKGKLAERHGLDKEHADLVALLAYERIRDYHRQFKQDGVIFTSSRLALLEKVLEKTSSGTWMQLVGETGTGKTTFAKRASWILNGEPAQYVAGEKFGDTRALIGRQAFEGDQSYYQFGPLVIALTGCLDSREMDEAIRTGRETSGKLLIVDELNKFDQDSLFGALKVPATLQPGEEFNFKELPGVRLKMAKKGVAIVATQNPATARYERKELDPALDRLFYSGKEKVDYPPMTQQSPELYEIFLGILMDDNGRIRISEEELRPNFIPVEDGAVGIVREELNPDPKSHGTLYRFALAAAEVHKSFTQKQNVAKTVTEEGFLEKTALEMETLVRWIKGYSTEIEGGDSLSTYFEKRLNDFWSNIDSPTDKAIYERIFNHFGFEITNPRQLEKPGYEPLTPVEMGYITPKTPREVRKIGEEAVPRTKIYIDPETGEETAYLPTPLTTEDGELPPGTVFEFEDGRKYVYQGKYEESDMGNFFTPQLEEVENG